MSLFWILLCRYSDIGRYADISGIVVLLLFMGADCSIGIALWNYYTAA